MVEADTVARGAAADNERGARAPPTPSKLIVTPGERRYAIVVPTTTSPPTRARPVPTPDFPFEAHRVELTGYCYRMLGSTFDADDAVQETLLRAFRGSDGFEGRAALRSWLYRIATNVCFDMLAARGRRARPMDLGPAGSPEGPLGDTLGDATWVLPIPDDRALPIALDPSELLVARESIRLAFTAALQRLPPRQRAVLILRDVLSFQATEVSELLELSVPAVNSALQRARETLAEAQLVDAEPRKPLDDTQNALLTRYVDAFERFDIEALTSLLREDVTWSMPPYPLWLRGPDAVRHWLHGLGSGCQGSRLIPTVANGSPAFGHYRHRAEGGHEAWALQVLEVADGKVLGLCSFLDTPHLFPLFGLPLTLDP